jgi:hypothetical protein
MQKMKQMVAIKKPLPPFLRLHTGKHPCSSADNGGASSPGSQVATMTELSAQVSFNPVHPDGTNPARAPQSIESE